MLKIKKTPKPLNNENGVVFVTVLMLIISMMLLAVTVVNMQLNQATIAEREINQIRCQALSKGVLMNLIGNGPPGVTTITNDGIDFTTSATITDDDSGPNETDPLVIDCQF